MFSTNNTQDLLGKIKELQERVTQLERILRNAPCKPIYISDVYPEQNIYSWSNTDSQNIDSLICRVEEVKATQRRLTKTLEEDKDYGKQIQQIKDTLESNNLKYKTKDLPLTIDPKDTEGYIKVKAVEDYFNEDKK